MFEPGAGSKNALCVFLSAGHHAGGKDEDAPVAGGTDKLKYDTGAKVA